MKCLSVVRAMEKEFTRIEPEKVTRVPPIIVLCPKCNRPMTLSGKVEAEIEERDAFFRKRSRTIPGVRYKCLDCKTYWDENLERRGGCFIATATFGTPAAYEVNVLRQFRDNFLSQHSFGKKMVFLYYSLSPPLARLIEKSARLRVIVRTGLIPIVKFVKSRASA